MAQFIDRSLVEWFFANRVQADYETGYTSEQSAANDRLWSYLCEHCAVPSNDWLVANNARALVMSERRKRNRKPATGQA